MVAHEEERMAQAENPSKSAKIAKMKAAIRYTITTRTTGEQKRIVVVGNSVIHCESMINSLFPNNYFEPYWIFVNGKVLMEYVGDYCKSGIHDEKTWNPDPPHPENTEEYQNNAVSDNKFQSQNQ